MLYACAPHKIQVQVQPSAKREGFATVPGVSWSDVGALASVREELSLSILEPIAYPEVWERASWRILSPIDVCDSRDRLGKCHPKEA